MVHGPMVRGVITVCLLLLNLVLWGIPVFLSGLVKLLVPGRRRRAIVEWVAHHLADSETMSTIRLRRLLAEDTPLIQAYDEVEFARRLHYERPIEQSLALFAAVRSSNLELLASLTDDEWARTGTHSDDGPYSVERWLEIYAAHGHDHADQIRRAREGRL
jgi:hypothetical protein